MKKSLAVLLAAVLIPAVLIPFAAAMAETPGARNGLVQMSDAELDELTAGTATQLFVLRNPGNVKNGEGIFETPNGGVRCINCFGLGSEAPAGLKIITNRGHMEGKTLCIGSSTIPGLC